MSKARFLSAHEVDGVKYQAGALVDLPPAAAKSLKSAGVIDDHSEAIAFAEKDLALVAVKHKPVSETATSAEAAAAETR